MKKIFFVLPLSVLLTYCSSTKPNIATGVSNVQVNGAASTTAGNTGDKRDWSYSGTRDTAMNGTWQLEGMLAADGSWKAAENWVPVDSTKMMQADSATSMSGNSSMSGNGSMSSNGSMSGNGATNQTASTKKGFGAKLYDTSTHFFETTAFRQTLASQVKPFAYWQRVPELRIMADLGIFTGNTGCNSMSGSFNFSGSDMKVNPTIRTSKMSCNEYDEGSFVTDLLRVNNYTINNDRLELKQGTTTVLTFKRKTT